MNPDVPVKTVVISDLTVREAVWRPRAEAAAEEIRQFAYRSRDFFRYRKLEKLAKELLQTPRKSLVLYAEEMLQIMRAKSERMKRLRRCQLEIQRRG